LSCLVKDFRVKVESGVNKCKGLSIELRPPSDIPENVWENAWRGNHLRRCLHSIQK